MKLKLQIRLLSVMNSIDEWWRSHYDYASLFDQVFEVESVHKAQTLWYVINDPLVSGTKLFVNEKDCEVIKDV